MPDPFIDATAAAELVRSGEVSASELVEESIERIEQVDPEINAVVIPTFEKAREEAKTASGPFAGVPFVLKDTMVSKGDPYTAGIRAVKEAGNPGDHDSNFVRQMREAGFVLVGRSHTPELALVSTTESFAYGATANPWDTSRSVGGSSGGTAAAIAAGMVPVGHGSDGGGSVREPASKCGIVGIKPTRGRISQGPGVIDSDNVSGMAHEGVLSRSVRDLAALLDTVGGRFPGDPFAATPPRRPYVEEVGADPGRLKIGVCTTDPAGEFEVDPECAAAARHAADVLADHGHDLSDSYPKSIEQESWPVEFMPCVAVVVRREVLRFGEMIGRPLTEDDVEPQTWAYFNMGGDVTGEMYAAGVDALRTRGAALESWWEDEGYDLWLTPTLTIQTPPLGEFKPTKEDPFGSLGLEPSRFTVPSNVSGQPALSLPLHWAEDGMPLGVQLTAAYDREDLLLRVAAQLEEAMPWADRRPPISAGVASS
jgi:amidase